MARTLTLNDGTTIPQLGFGTYLVPPDETAATVADALAAGYRHIDTAQMYGNEAGVGAAVRDSGIARDDLYLTTKLNNANHAPDDVRRTFDGSLAALGVDRLDLFLIHWPLPTRYDGDYVSTWRAMTELTADGRVTSVGVSNFQVAHLQRLLDETGVVPAVNQIEVHPYFGNEELRAFCAEQGIAVEAWSPLGQGSVLEDATVGEIARAKGATPAQVVLAWHLGRGDVVFPKSMRRARMEENLGALDVTLTPEEVAAIDGLDRGEAGRVGPDPDVFDRV